MLTFIAIDLQKYVSVFVVKLYKTLYYYYSYDITGDNHSILLHLAVQYIETNLQIDGQLLARCQKRFHSM